MWVMFHVLEYLWLYGAVCWLLFTGMFCSWSFCDIFEQLRIHRSRETDIYYAYMGHFLQLCAINSLLLKFQVQILKFWAAKIAPAKTDARTQNLFWKLRILSCDWPGIYEIKCVYIYISVKWILTFLLVIALAVATLSTGKINHKRSVNYL